MARVHPSTAPDQMCDSLGRSVSTQSRPAGQLVLPNNAYRLLVDFLKCERSFCNYVVPAFLPFGWVSLSVVRLPCDLPPTRQGRLSDQGPSRTKGADGRQERARQAVRVALQAQEAARERDA